LIYDMHRIRRPPFTKNGQRKYHHQRTAAGPVRYGRLRGFTAGLSKAAGVPGEEIVKKRMSENPAGRFGDPEEFGLACAFLCGAKSGFITGQNILLDGGAFPGTM
jgi:3-oxoacyl-[acyl-carrier protein] reductase